jgi:hypothetical protein
MFVFHGLPDKHGLVLAFSVALSIGEEKSISIISDNSTHYDYMDEEISGVLINQNSSKKENLVSDTKEAMLPLSKGDKVFLVTDHQKASIEYCLNIYTKMEIDAVIVLNQGSQESRRYIEQSFKGCNLYNFIDDPLHNITCVLESKVNFKKMKEENISSLGKLLVDHTNIVSSDIKSLFSFLKRKC